MAVPRVEIASSGGMDAPGLQKKTARLFAGLLGGNPKAWMAVVLLAVERAHI